MATYHRARQPGASLAHQTTPRNTSFQPIPAPYAAGRNGPFRMDLADVLGKDEVEEITKAGSMAFHCMGDTGGVKNPEPQRLVERGLEQSLQHDSIAPSLRGAAMSPSFCYHLGDVVYYNGEVKEYFSQFYDAYEHYPLPIIAIPGNHDGEPVDPNATSLEGFYRNFIIGAVQPNATNTQPGTTHPAPADPADASPPVPVAQHPAGPLVYTPESFDSGRPAMIQPFFYFTLNTPYATFIGLYSNVPEHGRFDDQQRAWFHSEMAAADKTKALIVAVHHPIYSFDDHHSGSPTMAKELEDAINVSKRVPNMVLSAHVHNYQRIELQAAGHLIPFFVIGNGGYWNLHHLAAANGYKDPETEAALRSSIDSRHGFMTFEISDSVINGHMTTVPRPQESWTDAQAYNASFDVFSYSSLPAFLKGGETITIVPADGTNIPPHTDHTAPHPPARTAASDARAQARGAHAARTAQKVQGKRSH